MSRKRARSERDTDDEGEVEAFSTPPDDGMSISEMVRTHRWSGTGVTLTKDLEIVAGLLFGGKGSVRMAGAPENPQRFTKYPTAEPNQYDYSVPKEVLREVRRLPEYKRFKKFIFQRDGQAQEQRQGGEAGQQR